jgi:8-oxo-dGTP diphosphatase
MMDVVCGVIRDDLGRYLICLRAPGRALGGHWEFPGGKLEPGESAVAALARELKEELGIDVLVGEALEAVEWSGGAKPIRLLPYYCAILAGEPQALDHEELLWCDARDLGARRWAPADLPIVRIFSSGVSI